MIGMDGESRGRYRILSVQSTILQASVLICIWIAAVRPLGSLFEPLRERTARVGRCGGGRTHALHHGAWWGGVDPLAFVFQLHV